MDNRLSTLGPFELRAYIEHLREQLIDNGKKMGLSHHLTIEVSQKLDFFLNAYTKFEEI